MSFGIIVRDEAGREALREDGTYYRLVDEFNPHAVGVPSSRQYPLDIDIAICVVQGNSRVLNVALDSDNRVTWEYADQFPWPEYSNPASIRVVTV